MNKNKTLKELGEEYLTYLEINKININRCKEKLLSAQKAGDENMVSELKRTLYELYAISRELEINSEHLINYYGDKKDSPHIMLVERREGNYGNL